MDRDLTKRPIPGLIREIAIPASIGFIFNTFYNVVDTYFAGLISTEALAALGISFPVFFMIIALGSGISTGATALISNAIGEKKEKETQKYAVQALSFAFVVSILLTILGLAVAPSLFQMLGAEGSYLAMSLEYINIIFFGTLFFLIVFTLNAILTAQGDTKTYRNFLIFGFFLNIILDPWFMFGGLGIPALGLKGVALATVLIQLIGVIYMSYKVFKTGLLERNCTSMILPRKKYYREIAEQGFPAGLNMMTVALGIFVITFFISNFSKDGVAAYNVATRIEQIILLPTIGLNRAVLAIVGQNNGARKYDRIKKSIRISLKYGLTLISFGALALLLFSTPMMKIFTDDTDVISIGSTYLMIAAFITWAYVILFLFVSALQGIKKPMFALYIGAYRQLVAPIIIFYLLAHLLGLGLLGIWWGIFIVNWTATALTLAYAYHIFRKKLG